MYLIVGLGNPEDEGYTNTRHNCGFNAINKLAESLGIDVSKRKFASIYGDKMIDGEKVVLLKPQVYMNLSGVSIKEAIDFYKFDEYDKLIVIYDDVDVKTGSIKIRKKGGAGTHNGMKSVIHEIGTQEFVHVRIGTGQEEKIYDMIDYVIGKLSKENMEKLIPGIEKAAESVEYLLKNGVDQTMNKYNVDKE
jgi:PTH1 family peptidyl-tRNA hydrolase